MILFYLALLVFVLCTPVWQLFHWEGLIAYTNGLDEGSYLQYDFSRLAADLYIRKAQKLVCWLHEIGLSGGYINLLFDLICPIVSILLTRNILFLLSKERVFANHGAVLFWLLPLGLVGANPVVNYLLHLNIESGALHWITMPATTDWVLLRSPEPQLSYLLLLLGITAALRWKRPWILFAPVPFTYSFLAVGWGTFCLMSFIRCRATTWVSILVSFVAVGFCLWVFIANNVNPKTQALMLQSRLPLLSYCGFFSLLLYLALYRSSQVKEHPTLLSIAATPWLLANQQIVSGWVSQPSSAEQYLGTLCVSALGIWWLKQHPLFLKRLLIIMIAFWVLVLAGQIKGSLAASEQFPLNARLRQALKEAPELTAIADIRAATVYNLVYPRQQTTLLSKTRTYLGSASNYIDDYRCFRKSHIADSDLQQVLKDLDASYSYEAEDYVLSTLGRHEVGSPHFNFDVQPPDCPDPSAYLIFKPNN